jgi:diguanylate cyclase (GGDEF)-like protein/PAS domain S-box-containing protein
MILPRFRSRPKEQWFRVLAEATSTTIVVFRERFLYVNPACQALTGYTPEELLKETEPWSLVHPDFREEAQDRARRRLTGEDVESQFEVKVLRKDGTERWAEVSLGVVDFDGGPAILSHTVDIHDRKVAELERVEAEERLTLAQRAGRSVIWDWDLETDSLNCSSLADEIGGPGVREHLQTGAGFLELIHPEDRSDYVGAIERMVREGRSLSAEIRLVLPNESVRWLSQRAESLRGDDGRVRRLVGVAQDFTERKLAEEALFREIERAQVTLSSIADGVIRTDASGAIDFINPVAERLSGRTLTDVYGQKVIDVYPVVNEATRTPGFDLVEQCLREHRPVSPPGNRVLTARNGAEYTVKDSAVPLKDRNGDIVGVVLIFKDISQMRELQQEMHRIESHDGLTGLMNRHAFERHLETLLPAVIATGRQYALCHLDLDEFKLINDSCGHAAGDEFICQITSVLAAKVREADLIARMGGDEFAVLMADMETPEARERAEELAEAVRRVRFSWDDRIFAVGVSIGLVPISHETPSADAILNAADAACHVAKESGRNRIHEYEPGDAAIAERSGGMQWISRIHKALAEDRFVLFQQPVVPMSENASLAPLFEILVRMTDEEGALVPPNNFIPSAERYHLISSIDRWVIQNALTALGQVDESVRFIFNVSGQSVSEESFQSFVMEQFRSSRVSPERVLFEITETAAIADLQRAMRFISIFKGLGCRFVLDDFGKGVSSYTYLKNLPVDLLKIEGEFVRRMLDDPIEAAIVESINQVGQVVGLETIAECVETEAIYEAVREAGIDYAQGFWLARPAKLVPKTLLDDLASGPENQDEN